MNIIKGQVISFQVNRPEDDSEQSHEKNRKDSERHICPNHVENKNYDLEKVRNLPSDNVNDNNWVHGTLDIANSPGIKEGHLLA